MATAEFRTISVRLTGVLPIMFDRYAGDNSTQLPVREKLYLDKNGGLIIPMINMYSMLAAENTKSVCRQFFGRQSKKIALGISGYTMIEPTEISLMDDDGQITMDRWGEKIKVMRHVARLKNGIPNPKERPVVSTPWWIDFTLSYIDNKQASYENVRQAFDLGGSLGLGTFRPFYGRYEVTKWEEQ